MLPEREVRLALIGDVHAQWERLDAVLAALARETLDGILLVGDLGSHDLSYVNRRTPARDARYLASVEELLRRTRAVCEHVLYVPGNHDLPDLPYPGNVDGRVVELAGLRIGGIGGAGPGRFRFAYEWDEDEIRARAPLPCDVLLCHAPPARTELDLLHDRVQHVGSEAIRERAFAHEGVLVCGHIHESAGAVQLERCLCVNVGALGQPFGRAMVGYLRFGAGITGSFEVAIHDLERGEVRAWRREA
jgi:Icc-related predicted phosphoesterase